VEALFCEFWGEVDWEGREDAWEGLEDDLGAGDDAEKAEVVPERFEHV
jgi:hypothetical protein